jgi:hypothetical protein
MIKDNNREEWLIKAVKELSTRLFSLTTSTVPDVRVSCGFPHGARGSKNGARVIGQCFSGTCAEDGKPQIFIHPELVDSKRVLDVLLHELTHASLGTGAGHGSQFKRLATSLGLEGKMTATTASPALNAKLDEIIKVIGEYPHSKLDVATSAKKQTTRMIKTECDECGYIAYLSRKWIDEAGTPICPNDERSLIVA